MVAQAHRLETLDLGTMTQGHFEMSEQEQDDSGTGER